MNTLTALLFEFQALRIYLFFFHSGLVLRLAQLGADSAWYLKALMQKKGTKIVGVLKEVVCYCHQHRPA